jgi:hypothetical protein
MIIEKISDQFTQGVHEHEFVYAVITATPGSGW